ncbi:transcriptional regulator [Elizabethkingia sp. JS20170427COW]|nr:transcriptional regulator [Elizabethkingia sp. JS20170427COW]
MRMLVLKEFLQVSTAVSLADLEERLNHSDRSTIYRTLKTFEKKGIIHSVQENNTTQYLLCHDHCTEGHHHDTHMHFYCTQCKKTTCLEEVAFENLTFPKGYKIAELKFVAKGICPKCQSLQ